MKLKNLTLFFILIAAVFNSNQIFAQTVAETLETVFNSSPKTAFFNGNVLVAENGNIIYKKSFGYADFSTKTLNTDDSTFQTASISKVFTSTAILQLRDKGKLKLDDLVIKYLPDFPFPNISVKNLLSHTSGLPDLELYSSIVESNPDLIITNKDIIPTLKTWTKPIKFQPGEKWDYCNTNYGLLVLIIEKISNLPFQEYTKKFIFQPAEMKNTYIHNFHSPLADKNRIKNHILPVMYQTIPQDIDTVKLKDTVRMRRIKYENYNLGNTVGDQNVISTTEDLLKFDQALYSERLLKTSTIEEALTPTKFNDGKIFLDDFGVPFGDKCSYGLGWIVCDVPNIGKIVGHDGFNRGISSIFYRNVTKKQTVIMFDNTEGIGFNRKVDIVLSILSGKDYLPLKIKISIAREFGATLFDKGIEAAIIKFNELKSDTNHYYLDEKEINLLGYEFLHNGYKVQSLETFKLNVFLFPDSFNVYDSYGEALAENGKKSEAILMYKKAISLNPNSAGSQKALKLLEDK